MILAKPLHGSHTLSKNSPVEWVGVEQVEPGSALEAAAANSARGTCRFGSVGASSHVLQSPSGGEYSVTFTRISEGDVGGSVRTFTIDIQDRVVSGARYQISGIREQGPRQSWWQKALLFRPLASQEP